MAGYAIVDSEKINSDVTYEPPLVIAFGVDKHSVGSKTITMGRTRIPPGGRNQAHYHSCEASFFIRKGRLRLFMGEDRREYVVTENQFVYIPAGVIHGLQNLSDTETAELIFTYGNCPSKDDAGTFFVEKPWTAAPSPSPQGAKPAR
jgi:quercetin dioxygenase-like cupin family protein